MADASAQQTLAGAIGPQAARAALANVSAALEQEVRSHNHGSELIQ